jgi:hypothetical protein
MAQSVAPTIGCFLAFYQELSMAISVAPTIGCFVAFYQELSMALSVAPTIGCFVAFYQEMSIYCLRYRLACNRYWREEAALVFAISFAKSVASSTSSLERRSNFIGCSVS